jgi:hypothetical protein
MLKFKETYFNILLYVIVYSYKIVIFLLDYKILKNSSDKCFLYIYQIKKSIKKGDNGRIKVSSKSKVLKN